MKMELKRLREMYGVQSTTPSLHHLLPLSPSLHLKFPTTIHPPHSSLYTHKGNTMSDHIDPAERHVTITENVEHLQNVQTASGLWDEAQRAHCGQTAKVEVEYPNGDIAVSFDDGKWLRFNKAAFQTEDDTTAPTPTPTTPTTATTSAKNVLTITLPLPTDTASLGLTFVTSTAVIRCVNITDTTSFFYPARESLQAGFTLLQIDGVRMRCEADVKQALSVAARVRGHCTIKVLDGAEVEGATTTTTSSSSSSSSSAVEIIGKDHAGSTLPEAESALDRAKTNLVALKKLVCQQEEGIATIEQVLDVRTRTARAIENSRLRAEAAAEEEEAPKPIRRRSSTPELDENGKKKKKKAKKIDIAVEMDKEGLLSVFEKCQHGKRRDDMDKKLAAMGNPELEDLDFWDLRGSSEELPCGEDQVAIEIFYFGEMEETGDPNTFKVHVIDRLRKVGVTGAVAPVPFKEAGCMYPLIGIPMILPWTEALKLGNFVFEDFGVEQSHNAATHGEKSGGAPGEEGKEGGGCAQQ